MSSSCTESITHHPMLTDEEFDKFGRIIDFIQTDVYVMSPDGKLMRSIAYFGPAGTGRSCNGKKGNFNKVKHAIETLEKSVTLVHSLRKQIFTMSANLGGVTQNLKNFDTLEFLGEYEITEIHTKEGFVAKLDEIFDEIKWR